MTPSPLHAVLRRGAAAGTALALVSCGADRQSAVSPGGPAAASIANLWWVFFWLLTGVFAIVMCAALWTLTRPNRGIDQEPLEQTHKPAPETEKKLGRVVTFSTLATVVVLFALLIASVGTGKAVSELSSHPNSLTVQVTGNQWWWQIEYQNSDASQILVTANEIHIPVGRPVQIRGLSNDVIHSFWVPNLNGKRDLIPSRTTTEWIEASQPGIYRGQCAEFCGLQHAHMILYVIAEPESKFEQWYGDQLRPSAAPTDSGLERGRRVFLDNACIYCHQIRGTTASGQNGPDLTHFGSRLGIASNTVPNTKGNLGGWIVDPQSMKPGNHMATIAVNPADLQPLLDYLESLK